MKRNLKLIQTNFDTVIVISEFVNSDMIQTLLRLSDMIIAVGESDEEVVETVPKMFSTVIQKLVLCLGVSVSSQYKSLSQ